MTTPTVPTAHTRTLPRVLAAAGVATAAVLAPIVTAGAATAAPAHSSTHTTAPSACRPANYQGTITSDQATAGARHYRVTLRAASGYANCTLQGFPRGMTFSQGKGKAGISATHEPGQNSSAVTFGPGHPVHFDIKTPNTPGGAPVDGGSFTLPAPGGVIPGHGIAEAATPMQLDTGTQIGTIQPGA